MMPSSKRVKMSRRSDDMGISLARRRRWYSEDSGDDSPDETPPAPPTGSRLEDMTKEELVIYARERRGEAKDRRLAGRELEQQLADTKVKLATAEQTRRAELERRGEFETISQQQAQELEDLRIKAAELERVRARQAVNNEDRRKKLPEHMQDLYPTWGSPDDQSDWLDRAIPKLTATPAPNLDGGQGGQGRSPGGSKSAMTSDEKKLAAAFGLADEQYDAGKQ